MRKHQEIVQDEATYVESIGKQDKQIVRDALADEGADTVIRMCFGMTGEPIPVRALGYYASALAIQELYMPDAEVEFVYPRQAANQANNVALDEATNQARLADQEARRLLPEGFEYGYGSHGKTESFFDTATPAEELIDDVASFLSTQPDLEKIFSSQARGRDYAQYVAAHLLMHDTNPNFLSINGSDSRQTERRRVVSVGAQSERSFYLARMACRTAKILPDDLQVETGQLFTRHVIPPYTQCREGEPVISEFEGFVLPDIIPSSHPVKSVERDLEYLKNRLAMFDVPDELDVDQEDVTLQEVRYA